VLPPGRRVIEVNRATRSDARTLSDAGQGPAVGGPEHAVAVFRGVGDLADFFAGRRGPQPEGLVPARGGQRFAVRRPGQGPDLARIADEGTDLLAGRRVPEADRFLLRNRLVVWRVAASRSQGLPVGGPRQRRDLMPVRLEAADLLAHGRVPDADRPVVA